MKKKKKEFSYFDHTDLEPSYNLYPKFITYIECIQVKFSIQS